MKNQTAGNKTLEEIIEKYLLAKQSIIASGFGDEIEWQDSRNIDLIRESTFLSEAAWVILSSGMKEAVIRKVFPSISTAFCDWKSSSIIVEKHRFCVSTALKSFGNRKKMEAIVEIAQILNERGIKSVIAMIKQGGINYIQSFPFMGPATAYHFAKNIGLDVAKPDRHLVRIASNLGYNCPHALCKDISDFTEEKRSVVDLVLWRYAVSNKYYLRFFSSG